MRSMSKQAEAERERWVRGVAADGRVPGVPAAAPPRPPWRALRARSHCACCRPLGTSPRRRTAHWSCRSRWRCSASSTPEQGNRRPTETGSAAARDGAGPAGQLADIRGLRRRHITCPWLIPARLCDSPRASPQRRGFRRPCWMRCWRRTGRGRCTGSVPRCSPRSLGRRSARARPNYSFLSRRFGDLRR
jgi:hypothetical protein